MGELLIKPYEISVWEDKLTQNGFIENKLVVIGSDTMTGPNKVYDPIFNKKANGEKTLTFSLKYKYFDPYIGADDVINPFAALLVNERKVKLKYDGEWYEFVVKDHVESSDELTWTYTCTDAFVLELSKNGYNITFDSELNNNQGTARELAKKTIENTDWRLGGVNVGKQLVEEPIYKATLVSTAGINFVDTSDGSAASFVDDTEIYLFYSYVKNKNGKFVQFIIRDNNRQYVIDDKNVITDTNFRILNDLEYRNDGFYLNNNPIISIDEIETQFHANRLAYGQLTTYDPVMRRTVDRFKMGDREIYKYTDYTYTTSNVVMNYIVNAENFNVLEDGSLQGWNPYVESEDDVVKLELVTKPELGTGKELADLAKLSQIEGFLKVHFNGALTQDYKNAIYNKGFESNTSFIESVALGDKFVFRWRAGKGELNNLESTDKLGLIVAKYTQDTPGWGYYYKYIDPDNIILQFEGEPRELNNIIEGGYIREETENNETTYNYVIDDVVQTPSTKYLYVNSNDNKTYFWDGENSRFVEKTNNNYLPYYYLVTSAKQPLPNSVLTDPTEKIGIFIYTTDEAGDYFIQDVQLTRFIEDGNGQPVLIGNIPTAASTPTEYYYLKPGDSAAAEDIETYTSIEALQDGLGSNESVEPVYNEGSEKNLSISVSQSNCFNILQTIAETFECWIDLVVEHDERGAILYDADGPLKYVYLKEYAGKDNYAGFKYGVNLQSIERTINSDEIVTKLIVDQSQSDYAEEGFISIANAASNPSGESYILNFDYYYNQGLLDRVIGETERTAFVEAVKEINLELQDKEKKRRDLELALTTLGSKRNVYTELVQTAQDTKSQALADFEYLTGETYEDYQTNHTTLDDEDQYTEEETVLDVLGELYISSATINNYSGLLTNIDKEYWEVRKSLRGSENYKVKIWVDRDENDERHVYVQLNDYLPGFQFTLGGSEYESTVSKNYFDITTNAAEMTFTAPVGYTAESATYTINDNRVAKFTIRSNNTVTGIEDEIEDLIDQKNEKIKEFNNKYGRFIQEGTWNSTDYIDSELYYLDALQVSNTSAQPTISYTINVVEISQLEGFDGYLFDAGDKSYVEDTEFFGWANRNGVLTPAREEVIVSEVEWHLDAPDQNIITVQNYKTRFEDFFQRVNAAVQTVQYNEATYAKMSSLLDANGTINQDVLLQSLQNIAGKKYNLTSDGSIQIDGDRITVTNLTNTQNLVIIDSEGIRISSDSGATWATAISGRGINIGTVYTGKLNTDQVVIGSDSNPSFRWDKSGISAYRSNINSETGDEIYDLQTYVRYDQYGLYGIKNGGAFKATSLDDVKSKAHFAVTWDGFFIKNSYEGGGQVSITSDNDFQVLQAGGNEKIKIGALEWEDINGNTTTDPAQGVGAPTLYGIRINDNNGDWVLKTGDTGDLEMKGTIYANAGEIGGMVVNNDWLRMNHIVLEPGEGIYSTYPNVKGEPPVDPSISAYPFWISDTDGSAIFNNITVRGAIKTSVFEYEEIQAVGGAFMFRPSTTIKTVERSGNDLVITTEKTLILRDGAWYKLSNYNEDTTVDADELSTFGLTHIYQLSKEAIRDNENNITGYELTLLGAAAILDTVSINDLPGGSIIDMGYEASHISYNDGANNYGIGINSSDNYINLPPRAISLFETVVDHTQSPKVSYRYRGILGTLPDETLNNLNINSSIYTNMRGTQGIYTDNMYIGDNAHYVAFYTENEQKKLRIAGADIVFTYDDGQGGTTEKTLDDRIEEIEAGNGRDAAVLIIDSSEGNIFRDNQGSTDLTVTIFYGDSVIINQTQLVAAFGIGAYLEWEYKDNTNNWVTLLVSDPRIDDNGFTIHLNAANVYNKANFRCKLIV